MSRVEQELLNVSIEVKRRFLLKARKEAMIWEQRVLMLEEELQFLMQHKQETLIDEKKDTQNTYSRAKAMVRTFTKAPRTLYTGNTYEPRNTRETE